MGLLRERGLPRAWAPAPGRTWHVSCCPGFLAWGWGGTGTEGVASAGPHASHRHCWLQWTPRKFSGSWVVTLVLPQKDNLDLLWGSFCSCFSLFLIPLNYLQFLTGIFWTHHTFITACESPFFLLMDWRNVWRFPTSLPAPWVKDRAWACWLFVVHQYRLD